MKKYITKGYINGIISAISYGTNPLFALPLYKMGLGVNSVLFYRYFFAVLIYGAWLKIYKKSSFALGKGQALCLLLISVIFAMSSIVLYTSFQYIGSGVACTLLFVYPGIVTLLSGIFFKERFSVLTIFSLLITLSGILMLNIGADGQLNPIGFGCVMCAALLYAVYIVLVKNLKPIQHLKYDKLSFYVMLFALCIFSALSKFGAELQPINDWRILACSLAMSIFPTIISLETTNVSIRLIGSVKTSILGALEPLTAIFFGVLLFAERISIASAIGIMLVLCGVVMIILADTMKKIYHEIMSGYVHKTVSR